MFSAAASRPASSMGMPLMCCTASAKRSEKPSSAQSDRPVSSIACCNNCCASRFAISGLHQLLDLVLGLAHFGGGCRGELHPAHAAIFHQLVNAHPGIGASFDLERHFLARADREEVADHARDVGRTTS